MILIRTIQDDAKANRSKIPFRTVILFRGVSGHRKNVSIISRKTAFNELFPFSCSPA